MTISYPLTATNPTQPPVTPTLSCPASVLVGQPATFSVSATDPSGLQLRYGMDWLGGSPVPNAWVPSSGYVNSGIAENVTHIWTTPGTYSVRALAQNTSGESSGWSPSCSVTVTSQPTASLTGNGCVLPAGGGTCNISLHWTASGTHNNLVDLGLTLPDNSVITAPLLGVLTLVDTAGNTTHPTSFLGLPADPNMTVPAGTPGTYAFKMYDNGTTNQIGSTLPLVACPPGSTVTAGNPETCTCPVGSTLDTSGSPWTCTSTAPAPSCSTFSASPNTVTQGNSVAIKWACQNVTSCTGSGFSTGGAVSGPASGVSSGPLTTNPTNFGITCTGPGGPTSRTVVVTVNSPGVTISANPTRVASRGSTTVTATATDVKSCTVSKNGQPWTPVSQHTFAGNLSGTVSSPPYPDSNLTSDTTYTVTCTGGVNASATASVMVTVAPQFAPF